MGLLTPLLAATALQGAEPMRVTALSLGEGEVFENALAVDFDRDGARDLLLAVTTAGGASEIRAHLRRDDRVTATPAWRVAVPSDVTAFCVGDLDPRPGAELLLLSADSAVIAFPELEGRERFRLLAGIEFLWQAPPLRGLLAWPQAVVDLDGDGLDDLLLPEPGGFRVLRQTRAAETSGFAAERLVIGESEALSDFSELGSVLDRIRPVVTRKGPGVLLELLDSVPVPFVLDEDGDGRLDVAVQDGGRRITWFAREDGFERVERALPFEVDLERELDVSYSSHLADLDGRPGAESVFVARARQDGADRTQVLVYGREFDRPTQVLVLQGLVTDSELVDLDGDGALDLATASIGDDFLEGLRSAVGGDSIEITLNVFVNRDGRFDRRPALIEKVRFEGDGEPVAELAADATGDGALEALLRTDSSTLRMVTILARGERWRMLQDRPIWTRGLSPEAVFLPVPGATDRSSFVAFEPGQLFLYEVAR